MLQHRLLIDASSILWASLYAGNDEEYGYKLEFEDKKYQINGWEHGFENFITAYKAALRTTNTTPIHSILILDGFNSRGLRKAIYPDYKGNRPPRPPEMMEQFRLLLKNVKQQFLDLGATIVTQDSVEADDIIAYFCRHLTGKKTVMSTDGDMLALMGDDVDILKEGEINIMKYPIEPRFVTLYKALVGDTSDNFKGARGFGDKTFIKMYIEFGDDGMDLLTGLIENGKLDELQEDVPDFKPLQLIIDSQDHVYESYKCAKFHYNAIDTLINPLKWEVGMVMDYDPDNVANHPDLKQYQGQQFLIDGENFHSFVKKAEKSIEASDWIALDIESSQPAEADEWSKINAVKGRPKIDVMTHKLTGLSITFGANQEITYYFSVDHKNEFSNCPTKWVQDFIESLPEDKPIVVHNSSFELPVLFLNWHGDEERKDLFEKDPKYRGFLHNVHDTMIMSSYVDENRAQGLKGLSKGILGYEQATYEETTQGRKMNELTGYEAFAYGCDDTIVTSALYNHFRMVMELENSWEAFLKIELWTQYLCARAFIDGVDLDLVRLAELEKEDDATFQENKVIVDAYLIEQGWGGATYGGFEFTAAKIKEAYKIVSGGKEFKTQVRTVSKLANMIREKGQPELAMAISTGQAHRVQEMVEKLFEPSIELNIGSPKQMAKLLYEQMGFEIRLRNKITDKMRENGVKKGNPKTDSLSIVYALKYDVKEDSKLRPVLKALQKMKVCDTRRKLYYGPYKRITHWKTGKVHANLGQSRAKTRRFTPNGPNLAQLPKQGDGIKFREVYTPHLGKDLGLMSSADFAAQEMRVMGHMSQDENLLACFIGDNKKDIHTLTAVGIVQKTVDPDMTYEYMVKALDDENHEWHVQAVKYRKLAKKVNFTVEYGAMAPKLAETMLITEDEAQIFIDAKYAAFAQVEIWKAETHQESRMLGYSVTMMGCRRHLREAYNSGDKFTKMKADRQAVNTRIQGSSAEMTKLVMSTIWTEALLERYDARFFAPIHDETVFSHSKAEAVEFMQEWHAIMTQPYADMMVPIVSSLSTGPDFGTQIEMGKVADKAIILDTIAKLDMVA